MYLIFDEETQIHKSHKRTANQWHPDNYVVMRGWKKQGDKQATWAYFTGKSDLNHLVIDADVTVLVGHNIKFDVLYEMANCRNPSIADFFARGGRVWDTQYAEYLLQAQHRKYHMNSMDQIAESYGGTTKIDQIKEMWKAGIQTADIDRDLLTDYLVGNVDEKRDAGDIGNTEKIYLGQVTAAKELGMYNALLRRMDGLSCTTDMEFNGIKVDTARAAKNQTVLEAELAAVTTRLEQYTEHIPDEVGFNWSSRVHTSCIIYGGTIKYKKSDTYTDPATGELARLKATADWPLFQGKPIDPAHGKCFHITDIEETLFPHYQLRFTREVDVGTDAHGNTVYEQKKIVVDQDTYLSGKRKGEPKSKKMPVQGELKTKIQDFFYDLPQTTKPDPKWQTKTFDGAGKNLYGTGADIIEKLALRDIPFLKDMGRAQALNKELGTYYMRYDPKKKMHVGMLTCVMADGIVHHALNHTSTVTGRLSSANPNMQNLPRGDKSEIKGIFVSRFGSKGRMIEADYSQLEVVVQGLLSGDKQLILDLCNRIDFHCKRVAAKYGCTYEEALVWCKDDNHPEFKLWKGRRTDIKGFSFQRAYGAGVAAIAEATGLDEDVIKDLIAQEERTYPGIDKFNAAVSATVHSSAEPERGGMDEGYKMYRRGYWQAPTGTLYSWRSHDAPSWMRNKGVTDSFSPPELKNYPVQGTGGEIVIMVLGLLWRYFVKRNNWDGKAFLVNTVHDCIWVDCHEDVVHEVARVIKIIMESVPSRMKAFYGMACPVPFPVDVEVGLDMLKMAHLPKQDNS